MDCDKKFDAILRGLRLFKKEPTDKDMSLDGLAVILETIATKPCHVTVLLHRPSGRYIKIETTSGNPEDCVGMGMPRRVVWATEAEKIEHITHEYKDVNRNKKKRVGE